MSDSPDLDLPVAAYRWKDHEGVDEVSLNSPEVPMHEQNEKFGADELVRRSDAEDAIEKGKRDLAQRLYVLVASEGGLDTKIEIQERLESIVKSYRADLHDKTPRDMRKVLEEEISEGGSRDE